MKRTIAGIAAGALLAAGCSGEADGQAEPTDGTAPNDSAATSSSPPESSTSSSPDLPHSDAPAVDNPLPESVLDEHPCDTALTSQQLDDALGDNASKKRSDTGAGPGCFWRNSDGGASIMVGYGTATGEGLSAFYQNTQPQMNVFRGAGLMTGFPAVEFQSSEESRTCTTAVGLADEYAISVGVTLGKDQEGSDACQGAAKVAGNVVGNLKAKA